MIRKKTLYFVVALILSFFVMNQVVFAGFNNIHNSNNNTNEHLMSSYVVETYDSSSVGVLTQTYNTTGNNMGNDNNDKKGNSTIDAEGTETDEDDNQGNNRKKNSNSSRSNRVSNQPSCFITYRLSSSEEFSEI